MKSPFEAWFIDQFGKCPGNWEKQNHLVANMEQALALEQEKLMQINKWNDRWQAAFYAWQAREKYEL